MTMTFGGADLGGSMSTQHGPTLAQQAAAKRAQKYVYVARLNKALKFRNAIERASALRDEYGPDRILDAARQWGDPEWALVCRWAGVPDASPDTRELVLSLLRERVASSARCAEAVGHYRDNQDLCHSCGVSL